SRPSRRSQPPWRHYAHRGSVLPPGNSTRCQYRCRITLWTTVHAATWLARIPWALQFVQQPKQREQWQIFQYGPVRVKPEDRQAPRNDDRISHDQPALDSPEPARATRDQGPQAQRDIQHRGAV